MEEQHIRHHQHQRFTAMLRGAQICLFIFFLADTYVTQLPELFLGRFLASELSISGIKMSFSYSIYGMVQLPVLLLAIALQPSPCKPASSITCSMLLLMALVLGAAIAGTVALALWPHSYPILVASRGLQGALGAIGYALALPLIVQSIPKRWQMQAIAMMTAGGIRGK
jgi:MFS family permease